MGVGMPFTLYLQDFGEHVRRAFGHIPYHVGSSLTNKDGWRDVDVRLILDDEEYSALELGEPDREHYNAKWVSTCLAWSAFGKTLTSLPIDFQIQQRTHANAKFGRGCGRSALFSIMECMEHERSREFAVERAMKQFADEHACPDCGGATFQPNAHCLTHPFREPPAPVRHERSPADECVPEV